MNALSNARRIQEMTDNQHAYSKLWVGRPEDDVAVIIDGANLSYMVRKILKSSVDYKVLSHILYANYPGLRSLQFIVAEFMKKNFDKSPSEREFSRGYSSIRSLLTWLRHNRFRVISKEIDLPENQDDAFSIEQADHYMDVEITAALYKAARFAKHIVFIGSNKKFAPVLRDLHEMGITITVIGIKRPETPRAVGPAFYTAEELREIDNFVDLFDPFFETMLVKRTRPIEVEAEKSQDNDVEDSAKGEAVV